MEFKDWNTLKEDISKLIEENTREFKWHNYQYYIGDGKEYSLLISMDQITSPKDPKQKKVIIKNVTLAPKNNGGY